MLCMNVHVINNNSYIQYKLKVFIFEIIVGIQTFCSLNFPNKISIIDYLCLIDLSLSLSFEPLHRTFSLVYVGSISIFKFFLKLPVSLNVRQIV